MRGWIRTMIAAAMAAAVLAAPLASLAPFATDAEARQRRGAEARSTAPQHDDGDEHDDDLDDGDRAESCEIDDNGDEFCAGEVIVAMQPGVPVSVVTGELASEGIALSQLGAIAGQNVYLFSYAVTDGDGIEAEDLVEEIIDIEWEGSSGEDERAVRWAELNYVGNAPQGNPSRFFPRDAGSPKPSATGASWGKARTGAPSAASCASGRGALVAVIDTGIDRTHPAFAGRIRGGWNAFDGSAAVEDTGNGINDDGDTQYGAAAPLIDEAVGHGTHVSGIILQAAPKASILPIKALDSDGAGQAFYLASAIHHAVNSRADVINLSLGSTGNSRAVSEAVQRALAAGIVVVAAAGNDGATGRPEYPAALPGVIAVGATDRADRAAKFNSTRSGIDLGAPGVAIASAFPPGSQGVSTRYATWTGSSMATPWVSGAVAALDSRYAAWAPARIASRLAATADPVKRGSLGAGRVDIGAAAGCR